MAKKRKYGSVATMHDSFVEHGRVHDTTEEGGYKTRRMMSNNRNSGQILREDMSRPCGLPGGAIQKDLGNGAYFSMNGYRVGDLFEQVDKNMREDSAAIKSITKPTNW